MRRLLAARGEPLTAFAERTGIPYSSLQNTLRGDRRPNSDQLAKIAMAGIDVNYLLTGEPLASVFPFGGLRTTTEAGPLLLADADILRAVHEEAMREIEALLSASIGGGSPLTAAQVISAYTLFRDDVFAVFEAAADVILEARREKRPIGQVLQSLVIAARTARDRQMRPEAKHKP